MLQLPNEVLLPIFQQLDPLGLENLRQTCRAFYLLVDDAVFKLNFFRRYPVAARQKIPRIGSDWSTESLRRADVLDCFRHIQSNHLPIQPDIGYLQSVYYYFEKHQLYAAERSTHDCVVVDCQSGQHAKMSQELLLEHSEANRVTHVEALALGLIIGFDDGSLELISFDEEMASWSFAIFDDVHFDSISRVALHDDCLVIIDYTGEVKVWDCASQCCIGIVDTYIADFVDIFTDGKQLVVLSRFDQATDTNAFEVINVATMTFQTPRKISRDWAKLGPSVGVDWVNQQVTTCDEDCTRALYFDGTEQCWATTYRAFTAFGPPGSPRWAVTATDEGRVSIFDLSRLDQPILRCRIKVRAFNNSFDSSIDEDDDNEPTEVAMNKVIVAVGRKDGSVTILDVLSDKRVERFWPGHAPCTGIRPLYNSSVSSYITRIILHPTAARGIIGFGDHVVAFDLVSGRLA